jgi:hypothetical protein
VLKAFSNWKSAHSDSLSLRRRTGTCGIQSNFDEDIVKMDWNNLSKLEPEELTAEADRLIQTGAIRGFNNFAGLTEIGKGETQRAIMDGRSDEAFRWGKYLDFVLSKTLERYPEWEDRVYYDLIGYRINLIGHLGPDKDDDLTNVGKIEAWLQQKVSQYDMDWVEQKIKSFYDNPHQFDPDELYTLHMLRTWVVLISRLAKTGVSVREDLAVWLKFKGRIP